MANEDIGGELVFSLMVTIGIGTFMFHHVKIIPYTVLMFMLGIFLGALALASPGTFDDYLQKLAHMQPELIFHIFLPILIFEGSYGMKIHAFREVVYQVILLAGPGVAINTLLLAIPIKYILYTEWNWYLVILFSSLLSATDPVAVVALLKDLGVDKRITAMVDGEAIMNDGTAIICFSLFLPAAKAGVWEAAGGTTLWNCIRLLGAAVVFGFLCGWLQARCLNFCHNEPLVETCITVAFAYMSFFVADEYLETSAVLTLCCQGIYLSLRFPSMFPGKEGSMFNTVWHFLVHFANTIIFSIVGIIIVKEGVVNFDPTDIWKLLVLYILMLLGRAFMIAMLIPILNSRFFGTFKLTLKECGLLVHSGLRGAVAMTLALIVSRTDGINGKRGDQVLFLTGGIVILTTLVNATTSKFVVRRLGHKKKDLNRILQMQSAYRYVSSEVQKELRHINADRMFNSAKFLEIRAVVETIEDPYGSFPTKTDDEDKMVNRLLMRAFKTNLWHQRDDHRINEKVVRVLTRLSASAIRDGTLVTTVRLRKEISEYPWWIKGLGMCPCLGQLVQYLKTDRDQMVFGMLLSYNEALAAIESVHELYVGHNAKQVHRIHHWIQEEHDEVSKMIGHFVHDKPESATAVVTRKGTEQVLKKALEAVEEFHHNKGLSIPDTEALRGVVEDSRKMLNKWSQLMAVPDSEDVLMCSPLCVNLPEEIAKGILKVSTLSAIPFASPILPENSIAIMLSGVANYVGWKDWDIGPGSIIGAERLIVGNAWTHPEVESWTFVQFLKVPIVHLRQLMESNASFYRNILYAACLNISVDMMSLHCGYARSGTQALIERCREWGSVVTAHKDDFELDGPCEVLCLIQGEDMDGWLGKDGAPLIVPRSFRVAWKKGAIFFVVGGNVRKKLKSKHASPTSIAFLGNTPSYDPSTIESEPLSQLGIELSSVNDSFAGPSRISLAPFAFDPQNHGTPIPLFNRFHIQLIECVEELSEVASDYKEFWDQGTQNKLLDALDVLFNRLFQMCSNFFFNEEDLMDAVLLTEAVGGAQNYKDFSGGHQREHKALLRKFTTWKKKLQQGVLLHQEILDGVTSFIQSHFPKDKELAEALVKENSKLKQLVVEAELESALGKKVSATTTITSRQSPVKAFTSSPTQPPPREGEN